MESLTLLFKRSSVKHGLACRADQVQRQEVLQVSSDRRPICSAAKRPPWISFPLVESRLNAHKLRKRVEMSIAIA